MLLLFGALSADTVSSGQLKWIRQFGDGNVTEAIAVSTVGNNEYVFGLTSGAVPGQSNLGSLDVFVIKYDGSGNVVWARQFGSTGHDEGRGVATSTGVYISGGTLGSFPGQVNLGGIDAFVSKYDLDGNAIWNHQFGTAGEDIAWGMAADDSAIFVGGYTRGTFPGQNRSGSYDAFLTKFDPNGTQIWTVQFGSSGSDEVIAVAVNGADIYVAGLVEGSLPGQVNLGGVDGFVRKYSANGTEVWTRETGTPYFDALAAIAVAPDGFYTAGVTGGSFGNNANKGGEDWFVQRYDGDGNRMWTVQFGTNGSDYAIAVAYSQERVYVAGRVAGALQNQTYWGADDAFVSELDTDGNEVWSSQFGTPATDFAVGLAVDGPNLFVAGHTDGNLSIHQSAGIDKTTGYVLKIETSAPRVITTTQTTTITRPAVTTTQRTTVTVTTSLTPEPIPSTVTTTLVTTSIVQQGYEDYTPYLLVGLGIAILGLSIGVALRTRIRKR